MALESEVVQPAAWNARVTPPAEPTKIRFTRSADAPDNLSARCEGSVSMAARVSDLSSGLSRLVGRPEESTSAFSTFKGWTSSSRYSVPRANTISVSGAGANNSLVAQTGTPAAGAIDNEAPGYHRQARRHVRHRADTMNSPIRAYPLLRGFHASHPGIDEDVFSAG